MHISDIYGSYQQFLKYNISSISCNAIIVVKSQHRVARARHDERASETPISL